LRRLWPDLPVVLISGRPASPLGLGSRGRFVPKPFALRALLDAVRQVTTMDPGQVIALG
jgi:hypothetical protein